MNELFLSPAGSFPELSLSCQAALRSCYGLLLLATLIMVAPQWKRFFVSERFGGYAQAGVATDCLQNPFSTTILACIWLTSAIMLVCGSHTIVAAAINLILCRYFFVHMRWKGLLRGFGAPGFMTYWAGLAVFLLELTTCFAPEQRPLALLTMQVDFAFIMLSAGLYKLTAGYASGNGMEYGMVNPQWGYWWRFYKRKSPDWPLFKILNQLAWSTEVVAGILMLIPQTRFLGSLLILLSFIFIATQIRLGVLCEMVILTCFLFFHPGSIGEQLIKLTPWAAVPQVPPSISAELPVVSLITGVLLWSYLVLLPLAHAGLSVNFYGKRALPVPLQGLLEFFTNFFGIIIWRVFSADHTNFFPEIYSISKDGQRQLISDYGFGGSLRFNNVGESITLTCLFTTLKYFASQKNLFDERLLRYARTLPSAADATLEFEYRSIKKSPASFTFELVTTYHVDLAKNQVTEQIVNKAFSVHAPLAVSPLKEGVRPGSYVPLVE